MERLNLPTFGIILVMFAYGIVFVSSTSQLTVSSKTEEFTFNLYSRINAQLSNDENMIFSPISIYAALSLLGEGTNNRSRTQIENAIHETELMNIRPFVERTFRNNPRYTLSMANRIFVDNSLMLNQTFLDKTGLNSSVENLDFGHDPGSSRNTINNWVKRNTLNQIDELLAPGQVNPGTRLCLVNAVALEATWEQTFRMKIRRRKGLTSNRDKFRRNANMMTSVRSHSCKVNRNSHFTLLNLPYKGRKLSLTVVMPSNVGGNSLAFNTGSSRENLRAMLKRLWSSPYHEFEVTIPKLNLEYNYGNLKADLQRMGITDVFDAQMADFSRLIVNGEGLCVSDVAHKATFEMNTEGARGAATTAFGMLLSGERFPMIRIDKPFILFIRNEESGAIIFMGKVVNPKL